MSKKTKKEIWLTILYCVISIGLVISIQVSLLLRELSGNAWIVLTVALFVIFIGPVYGIFKLSFSIRTLDAELGKELTRKTLIWIVIAIVSGAGAISSLFFGWKEIMNLASIPAIVMINLLAAFLATLFLLSVMVLISGVRRRKKEIAFTETTTDVEDKATE